MIGFNFRGVIVPLAAAVVAMMLFDWLQKGWLFVIQSWVHYVAGFVGGFILSLIALVLPVIFAHRRLGLSIKPLSWLVTALAVLVITLALDVTYARFSDYMVFAWGLIAATVVSILWDWQRKGRSFVVQERPQYVFRFVVGLIGCGILLSILVVVWRLRLYLYYQGITK